MHALASLGREKTEAVYFAADVRREKQLQSAARRAVEHFGRLDVLCANAGVQQLACVETVSRQVWDEILWVNTRGVFLSAKYAVPALRTSRGCIINIASTAGLAGYAGGTDRDVALMIEETLGAMGSYIALAFAASQFVAYFAWSNLGLILAISGADLLRASGLSGIALIFCLFLSARRSIFSLPAPRRNGQLSDLCLCRCS